MKTLKKCEDITYADDWELQERRSKYFENVAIEFYKKVNNRPNVLSPKEIFTLVDKPSLFRKSIWEGRYLGYNPNIIFGLKSGIIVKQDFDIKIGFIDKRWREPRFLEIYNIGKKLKIKGNRIEFDILSYLTSNREDIDILNEFLNDVNTLKKSFDKEIEKEIIEQNINIQEFANSKENILKEFDNNEDSQVDLVENGFIKLLNKNQNKVIDIDKEYIHQFVKVSNYIKTKKQNTQKIFETITDTSSQNELIDRVNLLKNQIHSYELLVFHSINMIGALVSEDLITFYQIYESFDKLGMFNSNWENVVSEKLTNIGNKLDDLMYSIYQMEQNIVSELSHLSYVTQDSFEELNRSVANQLREVKSSINTNNLWSGIQSYQLYKINKNTKELN